MEGRGAVDRRPEGKKNRIYLMGGDLPVLEEEVAEHKALLNERFSELAVEERAQLADLSRKLDRSPP
jgi:hypothetical protein